MLFVCTLCLCLVITEKKIIEGGYLGRNRPNRVCSRWTNVLAQQALTLHCLSKFKIDIKNILKISIKILKLDFCR